MSLVLTQEGAFEIWSQILGISSIGYPWVHLYSALHAPAHTDTYATYGAIELAVGGYAPIQLASPATTWTIAPIGAGAQAVHLTISWLVTGACSIDGYWLADASNTYSLWAELFGVVYTYPAGGGTFQLTLPPWLASSPTVSGIPCP